MIASPATGHLLESFAHTFGSSASTLLGATGWVTYIVGPEWRIKHFLALNTQSPEQQAYEHAFYACDPLAPAHCLKAGLRVALLQQQISDSVEHQTYRREFLEPFGIADALELFLQSDAGLILGCSLLRHNPAQLFSDVERASAEALLRLGDFALARIFPGNQASIESITKRFPILTAREVMLVQLVAAGLNNKQLSRELDISLPTVKTHLLNIFRKLETSSRTELVSRILGFTGNPIGAPDRHL